MKEKAISIVECPRDAMQGLHHFIPTEIKASYINELLKVGFDVIDAGSFVSPKSIPQMRDTADVLKKLDLASSSSKILAIVANERGADEAVQFDEISYLGYPFSISETFQMRNTNSTVQQSLLLVERLQQLCIKNNKKLVVYISMAFGNPYGDPWNAGITNDWVKKIAELDVKTIALADTVGLASSEIIADIFSNLVPEYYKIEIGAHLHCTPDNWQDKLAAAYNAGCRRFDTAIKGFGGCPMANDELVGNLATENLVKFLNDSKIGHALNIKKLTECIEKSYSVFTPVIAE